MFLCALPYVMVWLTAIIIATDCHELIRSLTTEGRSVEARKRDRDLQDTPGRRIKSPKQLHPVPTGIEQSRVAA